LQLAYIIKRLLLAIPTLFGVALIVFALIRLVPGDPIAMMIPPGASDDDIQKLRAFYGLDQGILQQFLIWISAAMQGDLGQSISLRSGVSGLILGRLPATLELVIFSLMIAMCLAFVVVFAGVYFRETWLESLINVITGFVQAIPDFLWGLILLLVFGALIPLLPISGRLNPSLIFDPVTEFYLIESLLRGDIPVFANLLSHLLLPSLALSLPLAAILARIFKASTKEMMSQDFVSLAQVKGYSKSRVIVRVAMRNALIPTVTLTGVQLTFLIGGTVLIEHIFAYPGLGNLAISAVLQRDFPLIQGLILSFALLFILVNLIVDLSYAWLDPRLRK
jgi:ABC-type dipeptide/oligopeptide/nickel transport system permease component